MNTLADLNCDVLDDRSTQLNEEEITANLRQLPAWELTTSKGEKQLTRTIKVKDFAAALALTNKIAELAEQQDHHPALLTEYGKVTVTWWSHKVKGLHRNDFIMAAKTDRLLT